MFSFLLPIFEINEHKHYFKKFYSTIILLYNIIFVYKVEKMRFGKYEVLV